MSDLINDINSGLEAVNLQPLDCESIAEAVETMARIASALGDIAVPGNRSRMTKVIREEHAIAEVQVGDRHDAALLYIYADGSGIVLTNGYDQVWSDLADWARELDADALTVGQAQELREAGVKIPGYAIRAEPDLYIGELTFDLPGPTGGHRADSLHCDGTREDALSVLSESVASATAQGATNIRFSASDNGLLAGESARY